MATGFAIDLVFVFATFFVQALNNSTLQAEVIEKQLATDELQFISIALKGLVVMDLLFEMFIYCYEVYVLHKYERE